MLDSYSLDYYADGNIKSVTENGQTTQYTYDRAGRLVREEGPDGAQAYQYDVFGNRAGMEVYNAGDVKSAQSIYSYDKNNRLLDVVTTYVDGTMQREDYTYDANGNRTMKTASGTTKKYDYAQVTAGEGNGYGVTMYSYDALGRMTGMQSGTTTASYTYDGAGLRQSKTVNGVTTSYVYDGTNIVREGSTYYTRGAAGLVSKKSGASVDYYYTDYHGSVVRCGDEAYSYDAFGNQTSETEDSNPFRYSGEYYDAETGLIYLRARYYDSGVGAFTSEDPAKDGLNWYVYCGGNPVNLWDPTGLASYVVVLAAGINSNSSSDYFYWLKNEIQYRMNTRGDTV